MANKDHSASNRIDKITPDDSRIQWKTANLNGKTYEYILAEPKGAIIDTIFLLHGFPDLAFGWRYQIPFLLLLGYRVVVPNLMGHGGTDAPESIEYYTTKRASDDLATLTSQFGLSSIILGGHDWGGLLAYRLALWHPQLISVLFVICTPFAPPGPEYVPLSALPNFNYQLQFAGPELQSVIVDEKKLRQFFSGMFGGQTPTGQFIFDVTRGVHLDQLDAVGHPPMLSAKELEFYVKSYARTGMRGPLNWYRTGELNFEDEKALNLDLEDESKYLFNMPTLFISCSLDQALPPALSDGMEAWFKNLTRVEIASDHWAMVEKSLEVNQLIKDFLNKIHHKASL